MEVDSISGGVLVVETSPDPQVEPLIRQHARRAVSEFVAQGMERAMRPTPLPPGIEGEPWSRLDARSVRERAGVVPADVVR